MSMIGPHYWTKMPGLPVNRRGVGPNATGILLLETSRSMDLECLSRLKIEIPQNVA